MQSPSLAAKMWHLIAQVHVEKAWTVYVYYVCMRVTWRQCFFLTYSHCCQAVLSPFHKEFCGLGWPAQTSPIRPPPFWLDIFCCNWCTFDEQIVNKKCPGSPLEWPRVVPGGLLVPQVATSHCESCPVAEIFGPKGWRVLKERWFTWFEGGSGGRSHWFGSLWSLKSHSRQVGCSKVFAQRTGTHV